MTAYPCVSTSVPLTYVWAFRFVSWNDMTTCWACWETFGKERICSFPHRHGDVSRKPETRDETPGRSKKSISCVSLWCTWGSHASCLLFLSFRFLTGATIQQPQWLRGRFPRKSARLCTLLVSGAPGAFRVFPCRLTTWRPLLLWAVVPVMWGIGIETHLLALMGKRSFSSNSWEN